MTNKLILLPILMITVFFASCKKDDPVIVDPPELITTVNYLLSPAGGGDDVLLSFLDLDGDGGLAPVILGGSLDANQMYTGRLELLNASVTPPESITTEIEQEDEEHQFFFETDIAGITFSYNDEDSNGNPIGLSSTLTTGNAGSGNITIILRHEPMKDASGVSDGDITNAAGETDIEVTFPIDVQ